MNERAGLRFVTLYMSLCIQVRHANTVVSSAAVLHYAPHVAAPQSHLYTYLIVPTEINSTEITQHRHSYTLLCTVMPISLTNCSSHTYTHMHARAGAHTYNRLRWGMLLFRQHSSNCALPFLRRDL